ncbi:hypothetical protein [Paraburkholderia susongensis]|uniref:Uncharacterized protein n=1 Tax=Paraburkholderia susongensis TaxID=1515439 RepID=A0A1X7M183_9BURK|nr:hypothetical protein [Paraburkholderia susongensis]SMG59514.1 hypothetical protein SAMN06265784_11382 [Paraburkholderia susongensis]
MTATPIGQQINSFTEKEWAALKEIANRPERPWWRDYPFLVSLLAFTLSLSTSIISAYESRIRDIHDQQAQLASALASLQDLNFKQVEIHEKYKGTANEFQAAALLNNEISSTLHTAEKLGLQLGTRATTADLTGVAEGLYGLGQYESTEKLLNFALKAAETANDASMALRDLGFYMIRSGKGPAALKMGQDYYERAYNIDREYDLSTQPAAVTWLRVSALLSWANALATVDCIDAQKHYRDGVALLQNSPSTIDFDRVRYAAQQQSTTGIGGVQSCPPLP